jgi:hypothetical protein
MDRQASLELLADALVPVLEGATTDVSLLAHVPAPIGLKALIHPDVLDVLANVDHFLADADIRSRDLEYGAMQEMHMRRLIAALRRGAPLNELLTYSFLSTLDH